MKLGYSRLPAGWKRTGIRGAVGFLPTGGGRAVAAGLLQPPFHSSPDRAAGRLGHFEKKKIFFVLSFLIPLFGHLYIFLAIFTFSFFTRSLGILGGVFFF